MAIVLPKSRPAIDIIQGGFTPPEEPSAHLGGARPRAVLQAAIPSVGRYAFVVGPNLLLTMFLEKNKIGAYYWDRDESSEDLFVDFGHEVIPAEPVRVRIEEVLYYDERTRVQLLRATLPDNLKPLRLSVKHPDELIDREVALIGYPARDSRNDEQLMTEVFRGVYGVKRLLPGRIRGYDTSRDPDPPVLIHDCSSSGGGCGGAPLVDIETGDVLGLHFAGIFLKENRAVPSWELARNPIFAEHGVLFAGPLPEPVLLKPQSEEPRELASDLTEARVSRASLVDSPVDDAGDLDPAQIREAIVIPSNRPAFLVDGGRPRFKGFWEPILKPHEAARGPGHSGGRKSPPRGGQESLGRDRICRGRWPRDDRFLFCLRVRFRLVRHGRIETRRSGDDRFQRRSVALVSRSHSARREDPFHSPILPGLTSGTRGHARRGNGVRSGCSDAVQTR